jgi:hypothetical protein
MLLNFFAGLFHKRCMFCKQIVHEHGGTAVQRFGKWYCSEIHADLYELELYEALRTVHCRHVGCHGAYVPWREAEDTDCSPQRPATLTCLKEDGQPC